MKTKKLIKIRHVFVVLIALTIFSCQPKSETKLKNNSTLESKPTTFRTELIKHEFEMQRDPATNAIPKIEKLKESENAEKAVPSLFYRNLSNTYVPRGPTNYAGRSRIVVVDKSDTTGNTLITGSVSGGVFRSTNGGASWTKVSPNNQAQNITTIAQDPRPGFQNIWYYGTGEFFGSSLNHYNTTYYGHGIWKSIDNGLTWKAIPAFTSTVENYDSVFDYINKIVVDPTNGDLLIASHGNVSRFNGTTVAFLVAEESSGWGWSDVAVSSTGAVVAALGGVATHNGVYYSPNSSTILTKIASNGSPTNWSSKGRIVVDFAPSNPNIIYAIYDNGKSSANAEKEADLWRYNVSSNSWTNFSEKVPDEPGVGSSEINPFAVQRGLDLTIKVKPDDENFVLIGGTSAYKIENINTDTTFKRVGGYEGASPKWYGESTATGVHHPDIHHFEFNPFNSSQMYTATDGGVHKTLDINSDNTIVWTNLNNGMQTSQFYYVTMEHTDDTNIVLAGAQDNGVFFGGTHLDLPNNTKMNLYFGGDGCAVGIYYDPSSLLQFFYSTQNGAIYTNRPEFRVITPTGSSSGFITNFYLDPDNQLELYYAGKNVVYRTSNSIGVTPSTWNNLGSIGTNREISVFATTRGTYDPSSSMLWIGASNGDVYRLKDPKNKTDLSTMDNVKPPQAIVNTVVSAIAFHPTNKDIAMVCYSNYNANNIFVTTNASAATPTWTLVERNLQPHSIRAAAITSVNGVTRYFVGTARGLYSSLSPTTTDWTLESPNTIGFAHVSGLVYRPLDHKLLVGTLGSGIFETIVKETALSISENEKQEVSLQIYPNPVSESFNLNIKNLQADKQVKYYISDLNGRIVKRGIVDLDLNNTLNISNFSSGTYVLVATINGKNYSKKIVKR